MSFSTQRLTLSELVGPRGLIADGDWIESKDQDPDGEVRLVQLADIGEGQFIDKSSRFLTTSTATSLRCTYLKAGDLLIARMPDPIGRACIFPENQSPSVTAVDVCIVRPDGMRVDTKWLMHALNSQVIRKEIEKGATGTTRSRISTGKLKNLEFNVPSLEEQKRIAAILDKAGSLCRKRQQAVRLADDFLRAVFLDMFGDPVTNPKGLPKLALGELIKLKSGEFLPASEMSSDGSIPVYGGNGINGYHDEKMFDESQIVIGRVGAYCGAVHQTEAPCWVTDNALYVAEKSPDLHSDYLLFALRQANLNQYASQSGQPLVSGGRIYPVEILVPDMPTQDTFAQIIQRHQALSESLSLSEIAIAQLGKSIQSNFF